MRFGFGVVSLPNGSSEVAGFEVKQEDGEAGGGGGGGGSAVKDLPMPTVDPEAQRNPEKASQKKKLDYPARI